MATKYRVQIALDKISKDSNNFKSFKYSFEKDFLEKLNLITTDKNLYQTLQEGCDNLSVDYDRVKLANKMSNYLEALK